MPHQVREGDFNVIAIFAEAPPLGCRSGALH